MEEKKKIFRKNFVRVEGFLKENTLAIIHDKNGNEAINGSIIIAVDQINAHKVQFYVNRFKKDGTENKDYAGVVSLLPSQTLSVATYLKSNPQANLATALTMATKVWVKAQLEEFVTKDDKDEAVNYVTLKGQTGGIKSATDKIPFTPRATFDIDIYIKFINREVDGDTETGRLDLIGIVPHWSGVMMEIPFKVSGETIKNVATGEELVISKYIEGNYEVGQTANFTGNMINIEKEAPKQTQGWGAAPETNNTVFVRERIITGGHGAALDEDNPSAIKLVEVQEGMTNRAEKREENFKKSQEKKNGQGGSSAAAGFGFDTSGFTAAVADEKVAVDNDPLKNKKFDFNSDPDDF